MQGFTTDADPVGKGPLPEGPFTGVPYLLKDMVMHAGTPLYLGSGFFRKNPFVPEHSHKVIERTERAGFVIVGKTNACELGLLPITEPEGFGPTANPWALDRSPGGSSGGTGAAVAANLVPMAHGNDGGGSIRIPASACGVFGFKPSRGRNPGLAEESPEGITVEHCLSRSVRDSAALLDVTHGAVPGDRWWAPPPVRPFAEEATIDPKPLRIAFSTVDFADTAAHPDCVAAVHDVAKLCENLGHQVEEARPNIDPDRFDEAFVAVWLSMATSMFLMVLREARKNKWVDRVTRLIGEGHLLAGGTSLLAKLPNGPFERLTRRAAAEGARLSHSQVNLALIDLQRMSHEFGRFLTTFDCFLTPTLSEPPVRTGTLLDGPFDEIKHRVLRYAPFTPICNSAGNPGMSVPLCWNEEGLPIGVHFAGRFGDEATLFQLAGQLERERPWAGRRPSL